MKKPDGERISFMEAQMGDLKTDVAEVKGDVKKILAMLSKEFVPRNEVERMHKSIKIEIFNLKRRRWIENTASAVVGATLVFLIQRALGG